MKVTGPPRIWIPAHFGKLFSRSALVESGAGSGVGPVSVAAGVAAGTVAGAVVAGAAVAQDTRLRPRQKPIKARLVRLMCALRLTGVYLIRS